MSSRLFIVVVCLYTNYALAQDRPAELHPITDDTTRQKVVEYPFSIQRKDYLKMKSSLPFKSYIENAIKDQAVDRGVVSDRAEMGFLKREAEEVKTYIELSAMFKISPDELNLDVSEISMMERPFRSLFDSRYELLELDFSRPELTAVLGISASVFAVVQRDFVHCEGEECNIVNTRTCGEKFSLCQSEPYWNQPSISIGTAFLVDSQYIVTAKHVLEKVSLTEICFISGFQWMPESNTVNMKLMPENIFQPESIIASDELDQYDLAIIKLKKPTQIPPIEVVDSKKLVADMRIYSLGYPLGLPIKFTTNARITGIKENLFCESSLDTYQGNSGSPVFDLLTHKVIGIVTGGVSDFLKNGDCFVSNLCVSALCEDERFLNLSVLYPFVRDAIERNIALPKRRH